MTIFHSNQYLRSLLLNRPSRIQRFLRLQKYNFEMHYMQGSLLTVANKLSRATVTGSDWS